jgi:hypothetical protein
MARTHEPEKTEKDELTTGLPAENFKRVQETQGPDPVDPPVEPVKAEPVTIAPNEPYPTGGGRAYAGVPQNREPDTGNTGKTS